MSATTLAVRIIDQLLDAVALAYGLAHGTALAARLDSVRVIVSVCALLAATYAAVAWCDRAARGARTRARALAGAVATTVVILQRYATYVFACVLRAQIGSVFGQPQALGVRALVAPAIVALIVAAIAALAEHYHVEPSVEGVRTPLAFADSFIQAVAFAYGLSNAASGRVVEAALLIAVVLLACGAARRHAAEAARARPTAARFAQHLVTFAEQYTLYVMARLIYASALVRAGTLSHGAPMQRFARSTLTDDAILGVLVVLVVCVAVLIDTTLLDTPAAAPALAARAGRRLVDRFVDAIVIAAAFAHAAALVHEVSMLRVCAVLGAVLVVAYGIEGSVTAARAPQRALSMLAALASRYASYTLIQVVIVRYSHVVASARSLAAMIADTSTPIALVALLVVVRQNIDDVAPHAPPPTAAHAAVESAARAAAADDAPHILGDEYDFR